MFGDRGVHRKCKIGLWWIYELYSCGSGSGPESGSCEHGNELSGSIKDSECLEK
jgi:hypothetical protein